MKRRFVLAIVGLMALAPFLAADDELRSFDTAWTIHELADSVSVPVKQLASELGLELSEIHGQSLSQIRVSKQEAIDAITRYRDSETGMVGVIVAIGMIIVFVSLGVVAFLISLFRHMHIFDEGGFVRRSRSVRSMVGTITSQGDLSEQSIAAVIAAIFLHEEEVESENRLLLTWRRATSSVWRTGGAMPNSMYFSAKRGR